MRTSILAMIAAFGTTITVPALAQQSAEPSEKMQPGQQMQELAQQPSEPSQKMQSGQQMQDDADKGIKTRDSGASGYVADQEKPGASSHPPGQPPSSSNRATTGSSSGRGSETGGSSR
jgi:hypothetical protein